MGGGQALCKESCCCPDIHTGTWCYPDVLTGTCYWDFIPLVWVSAALDHVLPLPIFALDVGLGTPHRFRQTLRHGWLSNQIFYCFVLRLCSWERFRSRQLI